MTNTLPLPVKSLLAKHAALREDAPLRFITVALFLLAHVPLALLMYKVQSVATAHALAAFALGMFWALQKGKVDRVAYMGAYIAGSEVLWRMTSAGVFWEFGKYATAAIFLVAMLQLPKWRRHDLSMFYFALLLPGIVLTLKAMDFSDARQEISFNLSGPFALMVSVWFFSNIRLSMGKLRRLFVAFMGPAAGVAAITISATYTVANIRFSQNSNFATSGGFGPNQVSAILGLAMLFAFLYLMQEGKGKIAIKLLLAASMVVFAVQSAMTFSRGGLYISGAAALLATFFLIKTPRQRTRFAIVVLVVSLLAWFFIMPALDTFTGGAFSARMADRNLSHRDRLIRADLQIWKEHPVFGVGPGTSKEYRAWLSGGSSIAHTEFTRLLCDHGLLGLAALVPLLLTCLQRMRKAHTPTGRALVVSMVGWTMFYMLVNGMRLVAPSFLFGLACVTLATERKYFLLVEPEEGMNS